MDKTNEIKQITNDLCTFDDKVYYLSEDIRGKRPKFWLVDETKEGVVNRYLFKKNYNSSSREDVGEVFMSYLGQQDIDVSIVDAQFAQFKNREVAKGIISENYKGDDLSMLEFSGETLLKQYSMLYADNNKGEIPVITNSIKCYMDALTYCYPVFSEKQLQQVRDDMVKCSVVDYLFRQTDRHWQNISFLLSESNLTPNISLAPMFDNGNIAFLNRSEKKVLQYAKQLERGDKSFAHSLKGSVIDKNLPALTIDSPVLTTLSELDYYEFLFAEVFPEAASVYEHDLAKEIVSNPRIAEFYEKLSRNLSVSQVFEMMDEHESDEEYEFMQFQPIIEQVYSHRKQALDHSLEVARNAYASEIER